MSKRRNKTNTNTHSLTHQTNAAAAACDDAGYFSPNPEKAEGERFFLLWAVVWVSLMAFIVATKWFESFTPWHYMATGVFIAVPPIVIPMLFPGRHSVHIPIRHRYTTKANVYIFILSWNANYFWTHYFYTVLKATYTFEAHRLNEVPFALYLITHSYFQLYHVLSSMALRKLWKIFKQTKNAKSMACIFVALCAMSYVVAFAETFTIQNFPYYDIPDRRAMYLFGSVFYGLYFIVSFPMFLRLDEERNSWSIERSFIDSMCASMLITQLLDFWRIFIGPVVSQPAKRPATQPVPFVY